MSPSLVPLADLAWQLRWDDDTDIATTQQITALSRSFLEVFAAEQIDVVPGLATLTLIPSGMNNDEETLHARIMRVVNESVSGEQATARVVELPICYDGDYGPDLEQVAQHTGLSRDEVIARHLAAEYLVAMLGFAPGFPYLRGLPPELATPRRASPRLMIPAGSVGIAGTQTGIYPQATPGGWQLIGRTPATLFALDQSPPALLQPGDRVRFRRIDAREFAALEESRPESGR